MFASSGTFPVSFPETFPSYMILRSKILRISFFRKSFQNEPTMIPRVSKTRRKAVTRERCKHVLPHPPQIQIKDRFEHYDKHQRHRASFAAWRSARFRACSTTTRTSAKKRERKCSVLSKNCTIFLTPAREISCVPVRTRLPCSSRVSTTPSSRN